MNIQNMNAYAFQIFNGFFVMQLYQVKVVPQYHFHLLSCVLFEHAVFVPPICLKFLLKTISWQQLKALPPKHYMKKNTKMHFSVENIYLFVGFSCFGIRTKHLIAMNLWHFHTHQFSCIQKLMKEVFIHQSDS